MSNSKLYGRLFEIPQDILKYINNMIIRYPDADGIKRAKFLLNNKKITYQSLKRLKNFFDNFNTNTNPREQYDLAGGDLMKNFVDRTLTEKRDGVKTSRKVKSDMSIDPNLGTKPTQTPNLNN
jgi:hypothetical protein